MSYVVRGTRGFSIKNDTRVLMTVKWTNLVYIGSGRATQVEQ